MHQLRLPCVEGIGPDPLTNYVLGLLIFPVFVVTYLLARGSARRVGYEGVAGAGAE